MKIDVSTDRTAPPAPSRAPRDRAAAPAAGAAPPGASASAPAVDPGALREAIAAANRSMQDSATNVQFQEDSDSGRMIVRVIDSDTHQVLRQMPSEEMLAISKSLDRLQGLMVHQKA
jgi:flagellar protein FlaG